MALSPGSTCRSSTSMWPCWRCSSGQASRAARLRHAPPDLAHSVVLRTCRADRHLGARSSQVGLIASLIIFPLTLFPPRAVIRGLALAWCLGFVFVIPLDFLAFKAGLHQAEWLPKSARARSSSGNTRRSACSRTRPRHRRRLDPGGESESGHRAGETGRLRVPPHHRAART